MSTTTEPDCGSSSCMFSAKGGMRTNGPCRCMENAGFHGSAVMAAKQMLREVLLLRARLDAMPHDRTWTKDKPKAVGAYWLSLAPDQRLKMRPVIRCSVYSSPHDAPGLLRVHIKDSGSMSLSDFRALDEPCFTGAQWKRVEGVPSDPFAEKPRDNSRDRDLP